MTATSPASTEEHVDQLLRAAIADETLTLPPLPQIAVEVMRLTRDDPRTDEESDASAAELARFIQRDVSLAGQVMRVANSALYARRTPVVTLSQAIAWLGVREIRNIAYAAAVRGQVFNSAYFHREMAEIWRESVITALFAQEIARLKRRNVESAYLCGLLHRVGYAVMLSRMGASALEHQLSIDAMTVTRYAAEHESRVGAHLAATWHLPLSAASVIAHWRNPLDAGHARTEVMEVALARQISDELRSPGAGGELPDSMLGPVSRWMDDLSIYPDELFTIMAQRAAIYATAESFA